MGEYATYLRAAGLGVVAGMRSMSAPFAVSEHLSQEGDPEGPLVGLFASPWVARALAVAAAGELVLDKLPIPARVELMPLMGRVTLGAVSGAVWTAARDEQVVGGALCGALGALVGSYAFYYLRRELSEGTFLPDELIALAEDALALTSGMVLVSSE